MGLSATVARYTRKIVHRIVSESPKVYNLSFWLQVIAVIYLCYVYLAYWAMGLLQTHWVLKTNLLLVNSVLFFVIKTVMSEQAQSMILRDLACINLVYLSYVLCYSFAGYPWWTFWLYLSVVCKYIVDVNFVDQ